MHSRIQSLKQSDIISKGETAIIYLAFFLLFPGFFFYHTLLGLGVIGAFLGGYFSIVSIALLFPLILYYVVNINNEKDYFTSIDFWFSLFLIYFFLVVVINYAIGTSTEVVVNHLLSIIFLINLFIIFKMINIDNKLFKAAVIISLIVMSLIIFYFATDGLFYLKALGESNDSESVATYQGFARSYLLTFVVVISFVKSSKARILLYLIAIPAMFLNGARSEFVALLFLIPILEIYYIKNKLTVLLVIFVVLTALGLNIELLSDILPNSRVMELIDLSQSTSATERYYFKLNAIDTIYESPFLGDFASYVMFEGAGSFAHNILSAWVDLGIIGFVCLLMLLMWPLLRLFSDVFYSKAQTSDLVLAGSLLSVTLLLLFSSKLFTYMSIGAALGAYSKYRSRQKIC